MVGRDKKIDKAAARPLLAYAPEFLNAAPVQSAPGAVGTLQEELEHRKRREELLRRKQDMLESDAAAQTSPPINAADVHQRMRVARDELQARPEPESVTETYRPESNGKPRRSRWRGFLAFLFGDGRAEPDDLLGPSGDAYGESGFSAVIRAANDRWEAEHGHADIAEENVPLKRKFTLF